MKTSNPHKTNINFSYVMQYTNELIGNDSIHSNNFMSLRSHTSPTSKPPIIHSTLPQSLTLPPKNVKKGRDNLKLPFQLSGRAYLSEGNIEVKQEMVEESWEEKQKDKEKGQQRFKTPRKSKKKEGNHPPTTTTKDVRDDEGEQNRASLNRKGLALISSLILEVLESQYKEKKMFTCGQISTKVLAQFCKTAEQHVLDSSYQQKERRTVKRRVYDSINVLIALGKIKKEKKWLYMEQIDRKIGEEIVQAKREITQNLDKQYERKMQMLNRVKAQYQKLIQLKKRNQQLEEMKEVKIESTISTQAFKQHQQGPYRFPLLLAYTDKQKKIRINIDRQPKSKHPQWDQKVNIQAEPLYLLSEMGSLHYLCFKQQSEQSKQKAKAR